MNMPTSHRENNNNKSKFGCGVLIKFYVFGKKPIFSYNKGLACNYYKMLVVNEMVPPTSVSYPKLLITHQLIMFGVEISKILQF